MRRSRWLALALLLAGCPTPHGDDDAAQVYSFADIRNEAKAGNSIAYGIPAAALIDFRGAPIQLRSPPYSSADLPQDPSVDGAPIFPAFSEGQPAAYLATDLWYDRAPVWVQPVYVVVSSYDANNPFSKQLPGTGLVFSVGPESSFYSPYWRFEYAEVPAGTAPESLRSTKAVLDAATALHRGGIWIFSLVPLDVAPSAPAGAPAVRPLNGDAITQVKVRTGWFDGELTGVFDYGLDGFTFSDDDEVNETALFEFVANLPDGGVLSLGLPKVGGVGPLYSGATAYAPGGVPYFGGLWRNEWVTLPPTASIFVPPTLPLLQANLRALNLVQVPDIADAVAALPRVNDYALRVALDASCFSGDGGAYFPQGCVWLDSQAQIEALLTPASISETDLTITCPMMEYLGKPVPSP